METEGITAFCNRAAAQHKRRLVVGLNIDNSVNIGVITQSDITHSKVFIVRVFAQLIRVYFNALIAHSSSIQNIVLDFHGLILLFYRLGFGLLLRLNMISLGGLLVCC